MKFGGITIIDLRGLPSLTFEDPVKVFLEGWLSSIICIVYIGYSSFRYAIAGVGIYNRFAISLNLRLIGVPPICLLILKGIAVTGSVGRKANGRSIENCNKGGG